MKKNKYRKMIQKSTKYEYQKVGELDEKIRKDD